MVFPWVGDRRPRVAVKAEVCEAGAVSRNERLQYALHPWSSFVIVPLFALANAGVHVDEELLARAARSPVTLGVVAGLVAGKFLGIGLTTVFAAHPRLGQLPLTIELPSVFGAAAVAGIGFTLSLFIAELAFQGDALEEAKVGVLAASLAAALLGYTVFQGGKAHPSACLGTYRIDPRRATHRPRRPGRH